MKLGRLNAGPNHLSRIETGEEPTNIEEGMLDAQLFRIDMEDNYYDQIIHLLAMGIARKDLTTS